MTQQAEPLSPNDRAQIITRVMDSTDDPLADLPRAWVYDAVRSELQRLKRILDGEPAWKQELRRMRDERERTNLAIIANDAFWNKTLGMKEGRPSVEAMRYAIDAVIESLPAETQADREHV